MGQVANEPHGIREECRVAAAQLPPLDARGERGEELAVGECAARGEVIEQGGLARIGVADHADGVVIEVAMGVAVMVSTSTSVRSCLRRR